MRTPRRFAAWVALAVVTFAAVAACGSGPDDSAYVPYRSGERLRAQRYDVDPSPLLGWRDTQLEIDCAFRLDARGTPRCLPTTTVWRGYADPACTVPVAVGPEECGTAELVTSWIATCGELAGADVYTIGAAHPGQVYTDDPVVGCVLTDWPGQTVCALADAPLDQFVAARMEVGRGDRLATRSVVAADGAVQVVGILDRTRDEGCMPWAIQGQLRCGPVRPAYDFGFYHQDAACAGADVAYIFTGGATCPPPTHAWVDRPREVDGCTWYEALGFATVGAPVDDGALYSGHGADTCAPVSPDARVDFYEVGEPAGPAVWAALTTRRLGAGRLRTSHVATQAGVLLAPDGWFFDAALDAACGVEVVADGSTRCVPYDDGTAWRYEGVWGDPGCATVPLAEGYVPECGTAPAPPIRYVRQTDPEGRLSALWRAGRVHTGTVYRRDLDGACTVRDPEPWTSFVEIGEELPLTSLPALARIVD